MRSQYLNISLHVVVHIASHDRIIFFWMPTLFFKSSSLQQSMYSLNKLILCETWSKRNLSTSHSYLLRPILTQS
jgi:hypothetical protein